jgi:hypothetical protein
MGTAQLKRKLRELKRVEKRIRFGDAPADEKELVWNYFFSTEDAHDGAVKYSLNTLLGMDRQGVKQVVEEYFYHVYYRWFKEGSLEAGELYDPALLEALGLPLDAGFENIRRRFRELAKKYHPDLGGDNEKMLSLLETYRKLAHSA